MVAFLILTIVIGTNANNAQERIKPPYIWMIFCKLLKTRDVIIKLLTNRKKIKLKNPRTFGLTVIRNEITYQLLADGFRVHTKLPSDS